MNLLQLSHDLEFTTRSCTKTLYLQVLNKLSDIPGFTVNRQAVDRISLRPIINEDGQEGQVWSVTPFASYTTPMEGLCQYKEVALGIELTWLKSVTLKFPFINYRYEHQNYKPVTKADIARMTISPALFFQNVDTAVEMNAIKLGKFNAALFDHSLLVCERAVNTETPVPISLDDNVDVQTLLDKGLERFNDKLAKMKKVTAMVDSYQQYLDTRFNPLLKIYQGYTAAQKKIAIPG